MLTPALRIVAVVVAYWIVSISMVFMNREILSGNSYSIDAPFFITWFQCVISCAISFLYVHTRIPDFRIRFHTLRRVTSLTLVFVAMIALNNLCLKHMGVAFYFVGRSLTTVFNVIFTYLKLGRKTSLAAICCCGAIVLGFMLGIDQEKVLGTLSLLGVFYGVSASFFVSLNSIYTEEALRVVNGDVWILTFYHNLIAVIVFLPLMLLNSELSTLFANSELFSSSVFWAIMLLSGVFGLAIGYVTSLQIKYTSPLTHNISGTAKAAAQTVLATMVYQQSKTATWWLSNMIVLGASAAYARVRQLEMANKKTISYDSIKTKFIDDKVSSSNESIDEEDL